MEKQSLQLISFGGAFMTPYPRLSRHHQTTTQWPCLLQQGHSVQIAALMAILISDYTNMQL